MTYRPWLAPLLVLALPLAAQTKAFRVDTNHTVFGFKASTLLFDVPGRFDRYKVSIQGDPVDLSGVQIRVELEARSINTSNRKRDEHLRSEDFFDVEHFPKIVFTSSQIKRDGDKLVLRGTLEMHGAKQELEIPFTAAEGRNGADQPTWSYRATLPLDRLAYGIGSQSVAAKISLNKEVELNLMLVGFFEPAPAPGHKAR